MGVLEEHEAARHAVLFAESDAELAAVAGDRLARVLRTECTAIVIATEDHSRQLDDRMREAGVNPGDARRDGRLVTLDARETLTAISPGGEVGSHAFRHVVGGLVSAAAARGPVLAFGEMVGLLWEAGRVGEAIQLESAWNDLLEETGASLLCAYSDLQVDATSAADVDAVCGLHTSVLDDAPFTRAWHFPADVAVVHEARRVATIALRARGVPGVAVDDTEVVVAELVANAVLHARSPFSVRVRVDGRQMRVEVADRSAGLPFLRDLDGDGTSGRGLHMVTALADRWGTDPAPGGKVVWAEVAR